MKAAEFVREKQLAALAKKFRIGAGITKAQVARDMGVKEPSIFHAEESPAMPYKKLRLRMIKAYSDFEVVGPVYLLRKKKS